LADLVALDDFDSVALAVRVTGTVGGAFVRTMALKDRSHELVGAQPTAPFEYVVLVRSNTTRKLFWTVRPKMVPTEKSSAVSRPVQ